MQLDFSEKEEKAKAYKGFNFPRMRKCLETVKELAEKLQPHVSFSHNDLLSGNILVPKEVHFQCFCKQHGYNSLTVHKDE